MKLTKDTCIGTIEDDVGIKTEQYLGEILYPVFKQILENQEYREKFEPHLSRQFLEERFEYDSIGKGQFAKLREENKQLTDDNGELGCQNINLIKENKQLKDTLTKCYNYHDLPDYLYTEIKELLEAKEVMK